MNRCSGIGVILLLLIAPLILAIPSLTAREADGGYSAGSAATLEVPVLARHADVIGVKVTLPPVFKLVRVEGSETLETQTVTLKDGSVRVVIRDLIPKSQSKTFTLHVGLPEKTGIYSVSAVSVYFGGRTELLADETNTPALSCLFCNTPCRWSESFTIDVKVSSPDAFGRLFGMLIG